MSGLRKVFLSLFLPLLALPGMQACDGAIMPRPVPLVTPGPVSLPPPPLPVAVPGPQTEPEQDTYTIVVSNAPVRSLLRALARDAKRNIDIHPGVRGRVTLNAVAQTLERILERIAAQVDIRIVRQGRDLLIRPDEAYTAHYRVDYVNVSRQTVGAVSVATEIAATGGGVLQNADAGGDGNRSRTRVEVSADAGFWESLQSGLRAIVDPEGGGEVGDNRVALNRMTGVVTVHGHNREHEQVRELLARVRQRAHRQVLIEASIVEVELSDRYQSGVDWQRLVRADGSGGGLNMVSATTGGALQSPPYLLLDYAAGAGAHDIRAAIRLLHSFGEVRVLSSPKIMALNNQTALLKVVDEKVYFTVERDESRSSEGTVTGVSYSSEIHTLPVGLVLSVTPQITDGNLVTMNIRPTISRVTGYATDPAPRLLGDQGTYDNLIPEIQVREMDSVLQVQSGNTIVLGGLMQDRRDQGRSGVPGLAGVPLLGRLFSYRDDRTVKTELIIMLRPQVVVAQTTERIDAESGVMR